MTHHHHHRGAHAAPEAALGRAFAWGIALNTAFVAIEAAVGIAYDSMGLLSDAGHNLSDVASLLLALLAGLLVLGGHVDLLHHHLAALGIHGEDLALLTLVLAGQDEHGVVLLHVHTHTSLPPYSTSGARDRIFM